MTARSADGRTDEGIFESTAAHAAALQLRREEPTFTCQTLLGGLEAERDGDGQTTMPFVKLVVMIAALGSAAAGVALVASGVQAAALIILSAAIVATVLSDERGRSRRS